MFDAIVVGAGSAGCIAARRLAETGRRVTLIEHGPGYPLPLGIMSADATAALAEPDWFWPGTTATTTTGRVVPYRLGHGFGGGSAVHGLVMTPGNRADYDCWETTFSCTGWRWATMRPWFHLATEQLQPRTVEHGPLTRAFWSAAVDAGHPAGGTSLEPDRPGLLRAALSIDGNRRRSAADAYLTDAPSDLQVRAGIGVRRILFRNRVAHGVELDDGTQLLAGLVVCSAGALGTPALLARSGLPLPSPLAAADHPSFAFAVSLRPSARQPPDQPVPPTTALLRWTSNGSSLGPDLTALVMDHTGPGTLGRRYGAVLVVATEVASTGELVVSGGGGDSGGAAGARSGPVAPTRYEPGWLRHPDDRVRLRRGVRHAVTLLGAEAVAEVADGVYCDDRGTPLDQLARLSDDELDQWLIDHPGPANHPAATCRLGGLLDLDGAVVGRERLFVVDASALPHLPNANLHLPVAAVAERLAANLAKR